MKKLLLTLLLFTTSAQAVMGFEHVVGACSAWLFAPKKIKTRKK